MTVSTGLTCVSFRRKDVNRLWAPMSQLELTSSTKREGKACYYRAKTPVCLLHWPELFKSSKWRVFKIQSDHLELVKGKRGDFQERFVGNPEWDQCTRDSVFRALVWPIIICNLHPYHSHKRNDENPSHFLNRYMAMGHGNASGLKSSRSSTRFLSPVQSRENNLIFSWCNQVSIPD